MISNSNLYKETFDIFQHCVQHPCTCGFLTDPAHECSCSLYTIQLYMANISAPIPDRIDIYLEAPFSRAYHRILKLAHTIADLEGEQNIQARHLSEAVQYRTLDRNLRMQ